MRIAILRCAALLESASDMSVSFEPSVTVFLTTRAMALSSQPTTSPLIGNGHPLPGRREALIAAFMALIAGFIEPRSAFPGLTLLRSRASL